MAWLSLTLAQRRVHRILHMQHGQWMQPFRQEIPAGTASVLGHCGQWWPITSVPFLTPCCGSVYFSAATDEGDVQV